MQGLHSAPHLTRFPSLSFVTGQDLWTFPMCPVRLSGGTLGGGGGCLGSGLGAQASVTSFPTTLEPWQVLQLFVVGDFWTCSCHARGALSGGKMSISHGCGGLLRALGHEKLPWRVVL